MTTIDVQFEELETQFLTQFDEEDSFEVSFGQIDGKAAEEYEGAYEVTPSSEIQILNTADRYLVDNITIKPIPNNYGLITWDGSTLTVS